MCTCVPHHTHVYFTKHLSEYYTKLPVIFQFSLPLLLFQLLPSEKFVNTLYQNISSITLLVLFYVFNALVLCIFNIVLFTYLNEHMHCILYVLFYLWNVLICIVSYTSCTSMYNYCTSKKLYLGTFSNTHFSNCHTFSCLNVSMDKRNELQLLKPQLHGTIWMPSLVLSISARADISLI